MAEITIPSPIDCVWVDNDLFGPEEDHRQGVGRMGYWMDGWKDENGVDLIRPGLDRRPIWVLCPGWLRDGQLVGTPFCIDRSSTVSKQFWDATVDMGSLVVGQKPNVTIHPSIHLVGIWHGWLQEGQLRQA